MSNFLSKLTPEQSQALYDRAGFWLVKDLPKGSLVGIDGSLNQVLDFAGFKLIPPSLHLIVLSPPGGTSLDEVLPSPRTGTLYFSHPLQVVTRVWSSSVDSLKTPTDGPDVVVSKEVLKGLDTKLAPYPIDRWETWKTLFPTKFVDVGKVERVLGKEGSVGGWDLDGFELSSRVEEEEGDMIGVSLGGERVLRHRSEKEGKAGADLTRSKDGEPSGDGIKWAMFDLKRSWRQGAVGEETTTFARDKSWLFWHVVQEQCNGDLTLLLTQLALLLPLSIQLQTPSLLCSTYRRVLYLITNSHLHLVPASSPYLTVPQPGALSSFYLDFIQLLHAQLSWLPDTFFQEDLPEAENWFAQSITQDLQRGLKTRFDNPFSTLTEEKDWIEVKDRWLALSALCGDKFGWTMDTSAAAAGASDLDEDEEDEEDRPVVVEL
ncbi:mRNA splicing factor [Phaffia rhodozyma]|uniref:mRNA splicing factor n=1 Tax=Phaffia rhodozyma TaxID=264483 RepID=A0A0F7SK54_PHARH|nr:mRNA splicing factor [Phaffia rhodozyma]